MRVAIFIILLLQGAILNAQTTDCQEVDQSYSGKCETYYPNGNIRVKAEFKNGEPHGKIIGYYESGKVETILNYKGGMPEGKQKGYYETGEKRLTGSIKDGDGEIIQYRKNGKRSEYQRFENYEIVEHLSYSDIGIVRNELELVEIEAFDPYEGNEELRKRVDKIYENSNVSSTYHQNDELEEIESDGPPPEVIYVPAPTEEFEEETVDIEHSIIDFPDVEAHFPGGPEAMQKFIGKNVYYPAVAIEKNIQGRVYLAFVIEPDGSISNITVERGVHESIDKEGIRLLLTMPNWIPGEVKGQKARTRCRLPINFTLD